MSKLYSLNKTERLKSVKLTKHLFSNGESVFQYPLKCLYIQVQSDREEKASPFDRLGSQHKAEF